MTGDGKTNFSTQEIWENEIMVREFQEKTKGIRNT